METHCQNTYPVVIRVYAVSVHSLRLASVIYTSHLSESVNFNTNWKWLIIEAFSHAEFITQMVLINSH